MSAPERDLDALARRVERLEQRLDGHPERSDADRQADRFWALTGLKEHVGQPAVVYAGVAELGGRPPVEWQMGHLNQTLLDEDWRDHSAALASLGHPVRLEILQLVARGPDATAAELAERLGHGTTGQIYHHLRQLVAAGWLRSTTRGRHQIPPERVVPLLAILAASR